MKEMGIPNVLPKDLKRRQAPELDTDNPSTAGS